MKREEKDRRMSCSIDYEIEKKTVLMFAWCVIRMLETFLGAFFQHHEVLERTKMGGEERQLEWDFQKVGVVAAILVYWKVSQASLIAWRCEEIEALLRWVSVEEGRGGLPETLWNGGENKVTCNRPSCRIFVFYSYPCMNYATVNKDNLGVRPVQMFSQNCTCWRCILALFVKLTFLYRS